MERENKVVENIFDVKEEKKSVKSSKVEELENYIEDENNESKVLKGISFVDPYLKQRSSSEEVEEAEEEVNMDNVEVKENLTIFKTGVPIFHFMNTDKKTGRKWHNLETEWEQEVKRGDKTERYSMKLRLTPRGNKIGKQKIFQLVDIICGTSEFVFLEVCYSEMEINGEKITSYYPRISFVDDNGIEFTCRLAPETDGDKNMWDILLSALKKAKVVS